MAGSLDNENSVDACADNADRRRPGKENWSEINRRIPRAISPLRHALLSGMAIDYRSGCGNVSSEPTRD